MRQQASILNRHLLVHQTQVRTELVVGRILRCCPNALIKLLQLRGPSEVYKKSLNKLRGTTDIEDLESNFAASSGFGKHFVNCFRTVHADVNRNMRFKFRRGVLFREIVNDILEITACRLSWNEPVSNNDSARHKLLTIS